MFVKMYDAHRVMVRVWVCLCCEGEGEIYVQNYGEAWVTSMLTVRVQVQGQGLGLGFGVW